MFLKSSTLNTPYKSHRHLRTARYLGKQCWGFLATANTGLPVEVFDDTIRMNLRSAFLMTKYAPTPAKFHGNIVSAGSEAGFNGLAYNTPRRYQRLDAFFHEVSPSSKPSMCPRQLRSSGIDTAWTHKETGPMDGKMEKMLIKLPPTRHHRGSCKRLRLYRLP